MGSFFVFLNVFGAGAIAKTSKIFIKAKMMNQNVV